MTGGTSGGKRGTLLPIIILLLVAYVFLKIFSINVSFWILLITVIVIVAIKKISTLSSLTAKFPWTAIGIIAAIAIVIVAAVWVSGQDIKLDGIFQKKGLGEWEGGMTYEYGYFYLPSGESTSKTVCTKGVNVRIYDIKTEMPPSDSKTSIAVKIEDLDDYGRSVNFHFLVEGDNVSFVKLDRYQEIVSDFDSEGTINDEKWNYIRVAIGETKILYAIGNDGRTEYHKTSFGKIYQKDKDINYKISLLNEGAYPLKMGKIEVEPVG